MSSAQSQVNSDMPRPFKSLSSFSLGAPVVFLSFVSLKNEDGLP